MFKIDHSDEVPVMEEREEHFFTKDKVIIEPG